MLININLHPFQLEFFRSEKPNQLLAGGSGIGKSYVAALKILHYMITYPQSKALVAASTWDNTKLIVVSALCEFLDYFPESDYSMVISNKSIKFKNGSEIILKNLQKAGKLKGPNIDIIWIDEGTEVDNPEEIFEQLQNRLRSGKNSYPKQLIVTTNPGLKSHYLYKFFYENYDESTQWRKSLPAYDGQHLPDTYIQRLQKLSKHRRNMLLEGRWGSAEGQIYELDPDFHRQDFEEPEGMRYYLSFDYGYDPDPMVWLLCGEWKGRLYIIDEREFNRVLIERQKKIIEELVDGRQISGFTGDRSSPGTIQWVKDTFKWKFEQTSKNRYNGWHKLLLYSEQVYEDTSTSRLTIHTRCVKTWESLTSLVWDEHQGKMDAAPGYDHPADAARYMVSSAVFHRIDRADRKGKRTKYFVS